MTDRVHVLTVVLETDTRVDDVEPLVGAIKQLRNVAAVELHQPNLVDYAARVRTHQDFEKKLLKLLYPQWKDQEND